MTADNRARGDQIWRFGALVTARAETAQGIPIEAVGTAMKPAAIREAGR
jgi:hypothetical protein